MKVFVDHGSSHNLGDTAMIEGAVGRLLRGVDPLEVHVIDRPSLKTRIWDWPSVKRAKFRLVDPGLQASAWSQMRFLWRFQTVAAGQRRRWSFARLGRSLAPRDIEVKGASGTVSLEDWCRQFDAYHIVGGGNLTDVFPAELWRRCCLIHAFASQGKPVVFTGQQIGPWKSRLLRDALRRAVPKVDFLGLREPTDSVEFCRGSSLPAARFAVMGDDSFGLPAASAEQVETLLDRQGLSAGDFLAVNVRIASYAASHGERLGEISELMKALRARYGLPLVVVPIAMNEGDSDITSGHRLAELVGGDAVRVLDDPELTPALVKAVLGKARAGVGVSYHFCTFALSQGVPAVCISHGDYYNQKACGLARFWGDDRLAAPLGHGRSDGFQHLFDLLDDPQFGEALRARAGEAIQRWADLFDSQAIPALTRGRVLDSDGASSLIS